MMAAGALTERAAEANVMSYAKHAFTRISSAKKAKAIAADIARCANRPFLGMLTSLHGERQPLSQPKGRDADKGGDFSKG